MIGEWKVKNFPRCTHHAFFSHCAEHRAKLVLPVFQAMQDAKYSPWFDQHHYPAGRMHMRRCGKESPVVGMLPTL